MRHRVDATLRDEARRFSLRFACEDCAHWDARGDACVHGYTDRPSATHLTGDAVTLAFCKEFELGQRADGGP